MRCRRTISFLPMRLLTCALTSPADACLSPRVNACAGRRRGSAQAAKRARKGDSHARRRGRRPRRPAAAAVRRQTVRVAHAMCTLKGASGSARSPAAGRAACAAGGHPQKSHNNSPQVLTNVRHRSAQARPLPHCMSPRPEPPLATPTDRPPDTPAPRAALPPPTTDNRIYIAAKRQRRAGRTSNLAASQGPPAPRPGDPLPLTARKAHRTRSGAPARRRDADRRRSEDRRREEALLLIHPRFHAPRRRRSKRVQYLRVWAPARRHCRRSPQHPTPPPPWGA